MGKKIPFGDGTYFYDDEGEIVTPRILSRQNEIQRLREQEATDRQRREQERIRIRQEQRKRRNKIIGAIVIGAIIVIIIYVNSSNTSNQATNQTNSITGIEQTEQPQTANSSLLGRDSDIVTPSGTGTSSQAAPVAAAPVATQPSVTQPSSPTLTGTVSITGTAQAGQTLTANIDALGGSGIIYYEWRRGNTNVGKDNTYELRLEDVGRTLTVTVTRSGYSGSVTSSPTPTVLSPREVQGNW